ncbi:MULTISPECIES: ZinT/AdcA family metal-binding protein [unclassified Halomonas]|nr:MULTISPECIES: ZinT/AdcA family metal-binding protein [unclassified Halomonas]
MDGTLDPVSAHKTEQGDKTAEEYKDYGEEIIVEILSH